VEKVVGLPGGTVQIGPDQPVPGHAYIPIRWGDAGESCSAAAQLEVTPPDAFKSLVISATAAPYGTAEIFVCSGGSAIVKPTRRRSLQ
jgi:hypothetical protein